MISSYFSWSSFVLYISCWHHTFLNLAADCKDDERLNIKGFYAGAASLDAKYPECIRALAEYITKGSLFFDETFEKGIDKFPDAMIGMMAGKNTGKMLVDLR